ncbi:MAG: signal peptide peptidase SppA, partial [Candidatus Binataceae bacterium]
GAGVVLLIIAAIIAAAFLGFVVWPARVPRGATLRIRLAGNLREDAPHSPFAHLMSRTFPTLNDLRQALSAAAHDRALRSVIIEIGGFEAGLATAQELHDLLRRVTSAGKRVVVILAGDNVTVRDYLIACGAGEIVVNPDTALMMLGVAAGGLFLRNALEKMHIQAQTLQWKEYKGAAEMFSRESMSSAVRESLEAVVHDWEKILIDAIAAARRITTERARELLGHGFISARAAHGAGLADRVGYVEEIRAEIAPEDQDGKIIGLPRYLRHISYIAARRRRHKIALIHGLGPVIAGEAPVSGDFLSSDAAASAFHRASTDPRVRAIVFRVNSPGGSAVGSDLVWRAVREAQNRGKPVVVSMGDVAGSGGYYVAAPADAIVAEPATITGSIGVVYTKFNFGNLLAAVGVSIDFAKTNEISDALSVSRALNDAELRQLDSMVGELYGNFTAKVAEGRRLAPEAAESLARGRIWSGMAAKSSGLVDELGGLEKAVELAREKAGIPSGEPHELTTIPAPGLLMGMRLALMPAETPWEFRLAANALGIPAAWMPAIMRLFCRGGAMLLCPFF